MSGYVVLIKNATDSDGAWDQIGPDSVEARSAEHAVQQVAEQRKTTSGTFVAIPSRSWKPLVVTRQEVVQTKVEAAS